MQIDLIDSENYFGFVVGNGNFKARPNDKIAMFSAITNIC